MSALTTFTPRPCDARCIVARLMAGHLIVPVFAAMDTGELTDAEGQEFLRFLARTALDAQARCPGPDTAHVPRRYMEYAA